MQELAHRLKKHVLDAIRLALDGAPIVGLQQDFAMRASWVRQATAIATLPQVFFISSISVIATTEGARIERSRGEKATPVWHRQVLPGHPNEKSFYVEYIQIPQSLLWKAEQKYLFSMRLYQNNQNSREI